MSGPCVLMILDGYGLAPRSEGNAIEQARKPNIDKLSREYAFGVLEASGHAVGLPDGEDGNSEVGHINIGAGRVVLQSMVRINNAIIDGSFFTNEALLEAVGHVQHNNSDLHILGMVGLGSVHSYIDHLYALLQFCKKNQVERLFLHLITDGRDSPVRACRDLVGKLSAELEVLRLGKIATICGRYYAMDRDLRWERTEEAYRCLTEVYGERAMSAAEVFEKNYQNKVTDEFIRPTIVGTEPDKSRVKDGDAVVFFNFRIDRPRQLTKAFVLEDFENTALGSRNFDHGGGELQDTVTKPFTRQMVLKKLLFVTMTEYEAGLPCPVCFPRIEVSETLGEILSRLKIRQLRLAESEKERFVTYYFDGARQITLPETETVILPSPEVATYDLRPEMSTGVIAEKLVEKIKERSFDFAVVNIASPDMVAHTGSISATIKAIEATDLAVGRVSEEVLAAGGWLLITADHGNAEELLSKEGETDTEHSNNPVPIIVVSSKTLRYGEMPGGILADVAPTVLEIIGIEVPQVMTGRKLLTVSE